MAERLIFSLCIILVVSRYTSAQGCLEERECFPETIVTVPCESSTTPIWTTEPSTIDCSVYISCFNGIGIQMCCPLGLYYNPDTEQCDDPENVDCEIECPIETTTEDPETTTVSVPEEETTTEGIIDTTTAGQDGNLDALCANHPSETLIELPHPDDCNQFVLCENNQYERSESCPAGLHFNPSLLVCDSPDHAECVGQLCQNNPEGNQLEFASLNSCQKYFICVGSTTVVRNCAPGTVYDIENGWCTIGDGDDSCVRERPPPPPESVIEQCTVDITLKKIEHPTLCDVYYRCLNGQIFVRQCAEGLLFDRDREQCNFSAEVTCAGSL